MIFAFWSFSKFSSTCLQFWPFDSPFWIRGHFGSRPVQLRALSQNGHGVGQVLSQNGHGAKKVDFGAWPQRQQIQKRRFSSLFPLGLFKMEPGVCATTHWSHLKRTQGENLQKKAFWAPKADRDKILVDVMIPN